MLKPSYTFQAAAFAALVGSFSCTTQKSLPDQSIAFDLARNPPNVQKLWSKRVNGAFTDLNLSENGNAIMVATAPDHDIVGSANSYLLTRFGPNGKMVWRKKLKSQVKAQSLSDDGKILVVSNYDDEITAMDPRGKILWKLEGMCKPVVLRKAKKVICYHDDDAEPDVAFDVIDWSGKKIASYPITEDILSFRVSDDERNLVIGLNHGNLVMFGPDYKALWQAKVDGEILDVDVSAGPSPTVSVLTNVNEKEQMIYLFDSSGAIKLKAAPLYRVGQINIAPQGTHVFVYGNNEQGQHIEALSDKLVSLWNRGSSYYGDYTSFVQVTNDVVIVGFEDISETTRHSHLLAFNFAGELKWNIPLLTEEGSYLYARGFSEESATLAVGTDDGTLTAYRLLPN